MIKIYADGALIYDSRLRAPGKDYTLLGLRTTTALNKGGTAEIVMPPGHPGYSALSNYRTIVEIYRDDVLRFRGRALNYADGWNNNRTWTCEGELCFLQDAVSRPYLYQDTPAAIFAAVVEDYNSPVDAFKQLKVGTVTVTDANDYVRLESETAEQSLDTLNKLQTRCGGYFYFSTDEDGARVINWYAELNNRSSQVIEFGENLLDFARNGSNPDLMTGIIPYGAKNEETGARLDITSVNNGQDYIVDETAAALRGTILKPVIWDDVTDPANLLRKAEQLLRERRQVITSLQLSAVDLSYLGQNIDSFQDGDIIRVMSKPHAVDDDFQLVEHNEDWLVPDASTINLGKSTFSLTDADVAGDKQSQSDLHRVQQEIKADYKLNTADQVGASEYRMQSLIEQKAGEINAEVSAIKYNTDEMGNQINEMASKVSASMTSDQVNIAIQKELGKGVAKVSTTTGYTFDDTGLMVSKSNSEMKTQITEDGMAVYKSGQEVLRANNQGVVATDLKARTYLIVGRNSRFEDMPSGDRTGCFWIGE
jgi:phage minor structural protein